MLLFDDLIEKIYKLEKLKSIEDFVEFYYEEIDDFYPLFIDNSTELSKYKIIKKEKTNVINLLFMSIYEIIGNKAGLIINFNDFNSLKIIIFNEYILSKFIERKHNFKKNKLKDFEDIVNTINSIYNFFIYKIKLSDSYFINNLLIKKYIPEIDEMQKYIPEKNIYDQYDIKIKDKIKNNVFFNFLKEQLIPFIK